MFYYVYDLCAMMMCYGLFIMLFCDFFFWILNILVVTSMTAFIGLRKKAFKCNIIFTKYYVLARIKSLHLFAHLIF